MFFFFKQKTAYEMRISDWSSDVCSSDLIDLVLDPPDMEVPCWIVHEISQIISEATANAVRHGGATHVCVTLTRSRGELEFCISDNGSGMQKAGSPRSEEHTSELQSLMRISYAVSCLQKYNIKNNQN